MIYHEEKKRFEKEVGFCAFRLTTGLGGTIINPQIIPTFLNFTINNIDIAPIDNILDRVMYSTENGSCINQGFTSYAAKKHSLKHIGVVSNWKWSSLPILHHAKLVHYLIITNNHRPWIANN